MSKAGRPNLSLAGKREAPAQQKSNRGGSTSTRGARGRGGRGGGRGGGPRPKQELIQTGGVFSEGLGGDFPSRKKDKDVDAAQFSYSRREKPSGEASSSSDGRKDEKKTPMNMEGKASFEGWDALWQSDEQAEQEEMNVLCPTGFVSDLKRGSVMPVVLPPTDQNQFLNVVNKASRLSLEEDIELEDEEKTGVTEKTAKPVRMTPEQLIAILEASTSDLLHLQLPSVVASICNNVQTPEDIPMEVDMDPNGDGPPAPIPSAPTPQMALPQGRKIGKLQVTRKGRLLLQIGGHSIDITSKPTSGKQQGTVLLEVEPTSDPLQSPPMFSRGPAFENALYHLGNVKHNLVGSMSWSQLNQTTKTKETEEKEKDGVGMEVESMEGEVEKEVERLEREQAAWKDLADKWAQGTLAS